MQREIDALPGADQRLDIQILGINSIGSEGGNSGMVAGRLLPWLQDTEAANVWVNWAITYRDVVIVDEENRVVDVYNLTSHSLADSANYATLRGKLLDAAVIEGFATRAAGQR
ncbi:MAG TPA: hypothetical protein VF720_16935 [Candidatus Eisenbacteria bacterium]